MSAWLTLAEGLQESLPGLAGWADVDMIDGPPHGGNTPRLYCTVGYARNEDSAGAYERDPVDAATLVTETGWVRCELVAVTGDQDVPGQRRRVLSLLDTLGVWLAVDARVGGRMPYVSTARLMVDVLPLITDEGSAVRAPFSVAYTART